MYFKKCSIAEMESALAVANVEYKGNLKFQSAPEETRHGIKATLRVNNSRAYGARKSQSGRHTPSASWEAHRDFMIALYAINENVVIKSAMATYKGAQDFYGSFKSTANKNVGSEYRPVRMIDLSV